MITVCLLIHASFFAPTNQFITPLPDVVKPVVADRQEFQTPDRVQLSGWLGTRIEASTKHRLETIDTSRLLEGYRRRPGRQAWDGEHVGKWLHAATLAWANCSDPGLRTKLDSTVAALEKCQLPDGYLGTYLDKDRWTEWDVWAHKYNLIGLLTYVRFTRNKQPLATCRKMGDLLCRTFGDGKGQRDIIAAGYHAGMAPTSVLEPMTLLYRMTGEPRYLDFCKYIVRAWEHPNGPHIVSRLLQLKRVDKVGNGKAYEMLSCLNGALELYRTTGDKPLLQACLNAWKDIVDNRLYITGAASSEEFFHGDFELPNNDNVGETCVTVTWLQLNAQLLRLTGESRFAEQLEHVSLNQLLGAQQPDGSAWGYYVQMEGRKPYSSTLDGHCCLSSGPRGIALLSTFAVSADHDGAVVNLFDAGMANLKLADGSMAGLEIETVFPADGHVRIRVTNPSHREFSIKFRIPAWCHHGTVSPQGKIGADGYTVLRKRWKTGEVIDLNLKMETHVVVGNHSNAGKGAVTYGPLVLAADEGLLNKEKLSSVSFPKSGASVVVRPEPAPSNRRTWVGSRVFDFGSRQVLVPFADAGMLGARYKVWIPLVKEASTNLLADGFEFRSREGNIKGSIIEGDAYSAVVTFDGHRAESDWYGVTLSKAISAQRIVFKHGRSFHDGGWFDTSRGKPLVQIQRVSNGEWETIGELVDYPSTTSTRVPGSELGEGATFTLKLTAPTSFVAVRVLGVPASGDNPTQAFSSCGGLMAFGR